jgi:FlaA1/EpsC-like NDP-sugar epimerase
MIQVYKEKNKLAKDPKIEISKVRGYERFHEFLVTSDEMPFCHDIEYMYKITKKLVKHTIPLKDVNSSTATRISKNELRQVINELFDEVVY